MPTYIEMPKLSDTMTEGTLLKWLKKPGDKIEVGDIVAEVETDKATMEMEAFDDGTLDKLLVQEGQKVACGTKMAVLRGEGEQPAAEDDEAGEKTDEDKGRAEKQPASSSEQQTGVKAEAEARPVGQIQQKEPPAKAPARGQPSAAPQAGARVKASQLAEKAQSDAAKNAERPARREPPHRVLVPELD